MQKNNLTEKEMMKILNVGTITFENIKNNILSRNITVGTLFLICRCFNVTPSEMFVDLSNM